MTLFDERVSISLVATEETPSKTRVYDLELMELVRPYSEKLLLRIGKQNDGGYVVSERAIFNAEVLISLGYGNDFSFEKDFRKLSINSQVVLFDDSASFPYLLKEMMFAFLKRLFIQGGHPRLAMKNFLTYLDLRTTKGIQYFKNRVVGYKKLRKDVLPSEIIREYASQKSFLKIDIEGGEYDCLLQAGKSIKIFLGMIIEFHNISNQREVFSEIVTSLKNDFWLVNTHINNYGIIQNGTPNVMELSFLNKCFPLEKKRVSKIPSELDQPNSPKQDEVFYVFKDF